MAATYVSNITINSGEDFSQTFTLESTDSSSPLNLDGYTVTSQMRKHAGSSTKTDFTTSIVSPASNGTIQIALAYVSNITINSGEDFAQTFTLESSDSNSPLNLDGYTVTSQMRKYAGSATSGKQILLL